MAVLLIAFHAVTGFLLLVVLAVKVVVIRWWHSAGRFLPAPGITVAVTIIAVTAKLGPTSAAEQESLEERQEQRLEQQEEQREERQEQQEDGEGS